jgi:hypothetical protein
MDFVEQARQQWGDPAFQATRRFFMEYAKRLPEKIPEVLYF